MTYKVLKSVAKLQKKCDCDNFYTRNLSQLTLLTQIATTFRYIIHQITYGIEREKKKEALSHDRASTHNN